MSRARRRYDAGMSVEDAIFDISISDYSAWDSPERIAVNVATLYREYSGDDSGPDTLALFGLMARLYKDRR